MTTMKTIRHLVYLALFAGMMYAQTPTQIDVSRVKNAAQLGSDGKVLSSQLPAATTSSSSNSSSGTGASQTSQLLDWQFTRTSNTQLSFGASCLPASPCNVNIGGTGYQFTGGAYLINLANSHSGTIWVYISNTGTLSVGVPTAMAGDITASSTVTVVGNVNSQPADALALEKWDVSSGAFASAGYAFTSYLSYKPSPVSGTGIIVSPGSRDTIQIDTISVLRKFTCAGGPSTTLPSGATQGDICWDFNSSTPGKYVCANAAGCAVAGDWKAF